MTYDDPSRAFVAAITHPRLPGRLEATVDAEGGIHLIDEGGRTRATLASGERALADALCALLTAAGELRACIGAANVAVHRLEHPREGRLEDAVRRLRDVLDICEMRETWPAPASAAKEGR